MIGNRTHSLRIQLNRRANFRRTVRLAAVSNRLISMRFLGLIDELMFEEPTVAAAVERLDRWVSSFVSKPDSFAQLFFLPPILVQIFYHFFPMAAISINNSFTADHEKPRAGKKREMAGKMIFRNRPSSLGSAQRWENPSTVERIDLFEPPQLCKCRGAVAKLVRS